MKSDISKKIEKSLHIMKTVEGFEKVKFIMLYGSATLGEMKEGSDIDLAIYYDADLEEASQFRFKVLSELFEDIYDVQIYQALPLYVRKEVLKGEVVYFEDMPFVYEVAYRTIKEVDLFKKRYYDYIGGRMIT